MPSSHSAGNSEIIEGAERIGGLTVYLKGLYSLLGPLPDSRVVSFGGEWRAGEPWPSDGRGREMLEVDFELDNAATVDDKSDWASFGADGGIVVEQPTVSSFVISEFNLKVNSCTVIYHCSTFSPTKDDPCTTAKAITSA
jgi:hypothetical protein